MGLNVIFYDEDNKKIESRNEACLAFLCCGDFPEYTKYIKCKNDLYLPDKNIIEKYLNIINESSFRVLYDRPLRFPNVKIDIYKETYTSALVKLSLVRYLWECDDIIENILKYYDEYDDSDLALILAHKDYNCYGHDVFNLWYSFKNVYSDLKNRIPKLNEVGPKIYKIGDDNQEENHGRVYEVMHNEKDIYNYESKINNEKFNIECYIEEFLIHIGYEK